MGGTIAPITPLAYATMYPFLVKKKTKTHSDDQCLVSGGFDCLPNNVHKKIKNVYYSL